MINQEQSSVTSSDVTLMLVMLETLGTRVPTDTAR